MSFLQWLKSNPEEEESSGSQLSLLGEPQSLRERQRVDGTTVRKNFGKVIAEKGGNDEAQRDSTKVLTREVLGVGVRQLYRETGAKLHDRSSLPARAQEALMVGEVVATYDLKEKTIEGEQEERNDAIVASVRDSGRKVRKHFPW